MAGELLHHHGLADPAVTREDEISSSCTASVGHVRQHVCPRGLDCRTPRQGISWRNMASTGGVDLWVHRNRLSFLIRLYLLSMYSPLYATSDIR